ALPADAWRDQVFSRTLPFYLFDLPFYSELLTFLFLLAILSIVVFWATARAWQVADRFRRWRRSGGSAENFDLEPNLLMLPGATGGGFFRVIAVVLLLGFAGWIFLGNFELLLNSHAFMVGADYVDEKIVLPLRWLLIVAVLVGIPLLWIRRYKTTL